MVNLIAGRAVVPELMQGQMTGARIAAEAARLLTDATSAPGNASRAGRSPPKAIGPWRRAAAAPPPSFKKFWKDKPHMFRNPRTAVSRRRADRR